jgi:elongation of very long chain fatty acids protein 1
MAFEVLSKTWRHYFYNLADARIRDRFIMGSPLPIIGWSIFYVIFVKFFLNRRMAKQKAFNVRLASILLYTYLLAFSTYLVISFFSNWLTKYSWRCEPLDTSNSEEALQVCLNN